MSATLRAELGLLAEELGFLPPAVLSSALLCKAGSLESYTENIEELSAAVVLAYPYKMYSAFPKECGLIDAYYPASADSWRAANAMKDALAEKGYRALMPRNVHLKNAAARAGLGRYGYNQQIISDEACGPYIVLQLIQTDAPLDLDAPHEVGHLPDCAACGRCEVACPTGAIQDGAFIHNRCIRAWMMAGEPVAEDIGAAMGKRLLGCEICRQACPHASPELVAPPPELLHAARLDLLIDQEQCEGLMPFWAECVGPNYARPARWMKQAAICAKNIRGEPHCSSSAPESD